MGTAVLTSPRSQVRAANSAPLVQLSADNLGPRPIEELTSKVVPRDYALAWQTMAEALAQNRTGLLDSYFTGWAKDALTQRIAEQQQTGIHVQYQDHGHNLTALFYSPAGDVMQLQDDAKLEIQIFDGDKVIHTEEVTLHYIVLMTPGADRWLVRDLETMPEAAR
jgi:hypothetical protein